MEPAQQPMRLAPAATRVDCDDDLPRASVEVDAKFPVPLGILRVRNPVAPVFLTCLFAERRFGKTTLTLCPAAVFHGRRKVYRALHHCCVWIKGVELHISITIIFSAHS